MLRTRKNWNQIFGGIVMLGFVVLAFLVWLANSIGLGKALALVAVVYTIAMWIIIGIALIVNGLYKM